MVLTASPLKVYGLSHGHKGHPCPFLPQAIAIVPIREPSLHKVTPMETVHKVTVPMSWRLSMPTLSQPRRRSMFLLHHGLLISCDLLLCRGGHPLHQLHPGGLHVHSLHNGHMILHGDHHRFTATAPWAMVSSSAPQSKPTIAPQSKPANAPRMLSSLPLFPSLSHYFTAQVCYRSIAQVNSVMIQAHITVMYTTKLP